MACRAVAAALLVALLASPALTRNQKDNFPKQITVAKYVYLTTYYGSEANPSRIPPDDLKALSDLRSALRSWGYWTETLNRENADLILRVRKGGVDVRPGERVSVGSGPTRDGGPVASTGLDSQVYAGPDTDTLEVYDAKRGVDTSPLWRRFALGGLNGPDVRLLQDLRKAVEQSAKQP